MTECSSPSAEKGLVRGSTYPSNDFGFPPTHPKNSAFGGGGFFAGSAPAEKRFERESRVEKKLHNIPITDLVISPDGTDAAAVLDDAKIAGLDELIR